MKVTSVEARTCVVPLDSGVAFATRAVSERHYTLVRIRTDTGTEGIGFCYGGHKGGNLVTLAVRDLLKDIVVGRDPHQVEAIWEAMYREVLLHGRRGAVLRSISAVDIALWDAISKEAGLPLYRYAGGYREGQVPAHASGGYYAEGKGPDDLALEMQSYVDMGFQAVKMKVAASRLKRMLYGCALSEKLLVPTCPSFSTPTTRGQMPRPRFGPSATSRSTTPAGSKSL